MKNTAVVSALALLVVLLTGACGTSAGGFELAAYNSSTSSIDDSIQRYLAVSQRAPASAADWAQVLADGERLTSELRTAFDDWTPRRKHS